jgi:magnesium chelatase family protein
VANIGLTVQCCDGFVSRCTPAQVDRYRNKISGPLLDRFDMHVQVSPIPIKELQTQPRGESSTRVRERVLASRRHQLERQGKANAMLSGQELEQHCSLGAQEQNLMASAMERLQLSARAYDRTLRVARTLADMAGSVSIGAAHLGEALGYRGLDRAL